MCLFVVIIGVSKRKRKMNLAVWKEHQKGEMHLLLMLYPWNVFQKSKNNKDLALALCTSYLLLRLVIYSLSKGFLSRGLEHLAWKESEPCWTVLLSIGYKLIFLSDNSASHLRSRMWRVVYNDAIPCMLTVLYGTPPPSPHWILAGKLYCKLLPLSVALPLVWQCTTLSPLYLMQDVPRPLTLLPPDMPACAVLVFFINLIICFSWKRMSKM